MSTVRSTPLTRGLLAGLVGGVLAGLFALAVAEPSVDAAIALEEAAAAEAAAVTADVGPAEEDGLTRTTQKVGMVVATALFGLGVGAVFGVTAAVGRRRSDGDPWRQSLTLGVVATTVFVLFPALAQPPNPPAVGDPGTVGGRTLAHLLTWVIGVLTVLAAREVLRRLDARGWARAPAQAAVALGVIAVAAAALALLPPAAAAGEFPADLLWRFRLSAIGTQVVLVMGTAAAFGLLADRAPDPADRTTTTVPAG